MELSWPAINLQLILSRALTQIHLLLIIAKSKRTVALFLFGPFGTQLPYTQFTSKSNNRQLSFSVIGHDKEQNNYQAEVNRVYSAWFLTTQNDHQVIQMDAPSLMCTLKSPRSI